MNLENKPPKIENENPEAKRMQMDASNWQNAYDEERNRLASNGKLLGDPDGDIQDAFLFTADSQFAQFGEFDQSDKNDYEYQKLQSDYRNYVENGVPLPEDFRDRVAECVRSNQSEWDSKSEELDSLRRSLTGNEGHDDPKVQRIAALQERCVELSRRSAPLDKFDEDARYERTQPSKRSDGESPQIKDFYQELKYPNKTINVSDGKSSAEQMSVDSFLETVNKLNLSQKTKDDVGAAVECIIAKKELPKEVVGTLELLGKMDLSKLVHGNDDISKEDLKKITNGVKHLYDGSAAIRIHESGKLTDLTAQQDGNSRSMSITKWGEYVKTFTNFLENLKNGEMVNKGNVNLFSEDSHNDKSEETKKVGDVTYEVSREKDGSFTNEVEADLVSRGIKKEYGWDDFGFTREVEQKVGHVEATLTHRATRTEDGSETIADMKSDVSWDAKFYKEKTTWGIYIKNREIAVSASLGIPLFKGVKGNTQENLNKTDSPKGLLPDSITNASQKEVSGKIFSLAGIIDVELVYKDRTKKSNQD